MDLQSSDVRKQTPSGKHSHPEQRDKAPDGAAVSFGETLREEYQEIIERRKRRHSRHGRAFADDGAPVDLTGLALSGGGVRSAAFCLGALQAINAAGALNQVDYLSTVSGGGFVGGAMSANMQRNAHFAFGGAQSGRRAGAPRLGDDTPPDTMRDTLAVQYLRNFSNYLVPRRKDWLLDLAVLMRGWTANILMISALVLLLAGATVAVAVRSQSSAPNDWLGWLCNEIWAGRFVGTGLVALITATVLTIWALRRTWADVRKMKPEWQGSGAFSVRWLVVALVVCGLLELQGVIVRAVIDAKGGYADIGKYWATIVPVLGGLSTAVTFFARYLGGVLKSAESDWSWTGYARSLLAKAVLYAAALVLPVVIYGTYVGFVVSGLPRDAGGAPPVWLANVFNLSVTKLGAIAIAPIVVALLALLAAIVTPNRAHRFGRFGWAFWASQILLAALIVYGLREILVAPPTSTDIPALLYATFGGALWFLTWFLSGNANSIHRLYRDRISSAFLFDATLLSQDDEGRLVEAADPNPPTPLPLSGLKRGHGPYPIVNAALNIEGSGWLNMRGRNAEFFTFTPHFVGSDATCYVRSERMEEADPALDLATALAISGAALSSNMGRQSIRPLTPTLALLNLRLGYWMDNPRKLNQRVRFDKSEVYLLAEAMGWLNEKSNKVYLTDGGHIDNLGLYQLLKRRCKLIIVVDAEQDPDFAFPALMDAERFARIDLGIRIELPWELIRDHAKRLESDFAKGPIPAGSPTPGAHAALGVIDYDGGEKGLILYLKSSLTGDENDYILDYKRRYPAFPHESTGDQFFGEEQFEAYRALGFHAMRSVLSAAAPYATLDVNGPRLCSKSPCPELTHLRRLLGITVATEADHHPMLSDREPTSDRSVA